MANLKANPQNRKRPSKRVYPLRECANPLCGKSFIPTDKRQKYDIPQCRIDHNNDKRSDKNKEHVAHVSLALKNAEILKGLYNNLAQLPQKVFHMDQFRILHYRIEVMTDLSINKLTGKEIWWNYNYGLEGVSKGDQTFIIHYRAKTPY